MVHLGDQRAGRVEDEEVARSRRLRHALRHAVGREDHRPVGIGDLVELLDEDRALRLQALDHVAVVHDLVAHIDRRAEALERLLDDLDGAVDAGAEAARGAEQDLEFRAGASFSLQLGSRPAAASSAARVAASRSRPQAKAAKTARSAAASPYQVIAY